MTAIPSLYLLRYSVPYKVLDTQMSNLTQRAAARSPVPFGSKCLCTYGQEANFAVLT